MNNNISINITMDQSERVFHCRGEKSGMRNDGSYSVDYQYRTSLTTMAKVAPNGQQETWTDYLLSDEFLNEYIPKNLETFVTWKDILACGMIPEHRNNNSLREDLKYTNQCLSEAPSPAPAPYPRTPPTHNMQSSMVVEAKEVENNPISCKKEGEKIIIIYIDNENNDKYIFEIVTDSDFWKKYGMYFQNNLRKCYDILLMAFTENNVSVDWEIKEKNKKDIIINISCHVCDVFGFSVDMTLDAEEKYIDKLEKRVKELEEKVEKYDDLEGKVISLCDYITYRETIAGHHFVAVGALGHDVNRDWDIPMEDAGSPEYNELSQTRSGYRKEIWGKVMEEKGWNI